MRTLTLATFAVAAFGMMVPLSPAQATLLTSVQQGSCTTANCASIRFGGTYQRDQSNQSYPFETQVYVGSGECVRIDVISEDQDLEARLLGTDGTSWFNDDRNGSSDRRPLIKAEVPGGFAGWYTLVINKFDGQGPGSNFVVSYGRYVSGNVNCASPTPSVPGARAVAK